MLTAKLIRDAVKRFEDQVNAPVDWGEESAFKKEWVRRYEMVIRGEMELPPIGLGLMSNWKYNRPENGQKR